MKPTHALASLLTAILTALSAAAGEIALYNNTHLPPDPPPGIPPNAPPPFATASTTHTAIQFYTGETDNVSTAAVTMKRTGTPGGQLVFEIWDSDKDGLPGASVGTLGSVNTDSLPTELEMVTVRGEVTGLAQMTRYFLVVRNEGTAITGESQTFHIAPLFAGGHAHAGPGTPAPPESGPLQQALSRDNGQWQTLSAALGSPPGWLHARIGGKRSNEVALYDNTHLAADPPPFVPADAPPPFADAKTTHTAIQFDTGSYDNVSSASVTLKRTGLPGGKIQFEIWDTGEDGFPNSSVGTLGSVNTNDLPVSLGMVDVEGSVTGLTPRTRYYLVLHNVDTNITGPAKTYHIAPLFPGAHPHAGPGTASTEDGGPLVESLYLENDSDEWKTLTSALGAPPGAWQHARISATLPVSESEPIPLYDNTDQEALFPIRLDPGDNYWAQPFFTGESDNVSAVSVYLKRTGNPGGQLIFEIWDADENGDPREKVGTLGEVDAGTLPSVAGQPLVTTEGLVSGLSPMTRYFLVVHKSTPIPDTSNTYHFGPQLNDEGTRWPTSDRANELRILYSGRWHYVADFLAGPEFYLHASIEAVQRNAIDHDSLFRPSEFGRATSDPDLTRYPIGSEVRFTAEPIEGYEFIKWIYGENEPTVNPITITVREGTTLTPIFSKTEEPNHLQADIEPAIVVSWPSQSGRTYQIHFSTDMADWSVAIDGIEGTGERMMQCFIREQTEVFYRVEEMP